MRQEDFEKLWPERDGLSPEVLRELEDICESDSECASFAKGGDWVRDLLQDLPEEKAPANFSYQMGVYARNHITNKPSLRERPFLRWGTLGAGAVVGAAMLTFVVGPSMYNQDGSSTNPLINSTRVAVETQASSTPVEDSIVPEAVNATDKMLAKEEEDSTKENEAKKKRSPGAASMEGIHTVSTGE